MGRKEPNPSAPVRRNSVQPKDIYNEWMRRYIDEPERFNREWQTVSEFQASEAKGEEPDYGSSCQRYFDQIKSELEAA